MYNFKIQSIFNFVNFLYKKLVSDYSTQMLERCFGTAQKYKFGKTKDATKLNLVRKPM